MDRFIPEHVNKVALQKSKSVFTGKDIDLFNDEISLESSGNTNIYDDDSLRERALLKNNNILKKRIHNNNKNTIDQDFQNKYSKIHGQKHWIELKKSFNNKKDFSDILNIWKNDNILQFRTQRQANRKAIQQKGFKTILTPDHKKESEHLLTLEPFRVLDAPELRNDFYSNLLSWSRKKKLVVGLNTSIYIWSQSNSETALLLSSSYLAAFRDFITCVSYSPSLKDDLICCGTKHGRVLILKGDQNVFDKTNNFISMLPEKKEFEFLLCESVENSKGICTIKWLLKETSQETGEEDWTILCGNESGEVLCFDLHKTKEQWKENNNKFQSLSNKSEKNTTRNFGINTMGAYINLNPYSSEIPEALSDNIDTASLPDFNTNISTINHTNSNINVDYSSVGVENMNSGNIFLTTDNSNHYRNNSNVLFDYDITNMSIHDKDSTAASSTDTNSKEVNYKIITKTRYRLDLKSHIKCQTQQLCGMDLICTYDKKNKMEFAQLAVGGNDNSCTIWDISDLAFPQLKFDLPHTAAVKAVLFCPWLKNVLATGGGSKDRYIRIWHTTTGKIIRQYKTAGQITSLIWTRHKMELILTFGFGNPDQPVLMKTFKFPSMHVVNHVKTLDHIRVLSSALSPDFSTVALATNDETIKFFKINSKHKTLLKNCNNKDVYQRTILNLIEGIESFDTHFSI